MEVQESGSPIEIWCNQVAAEVLIPMENIRNDYRGAPESDELDGLARQYKVSTLVVLKRIFDAGLLEWHEFRNACSAEYSRVIALAKERKKNGAGIIAMSNPCE